MKERHSKFQRHGVQHSVDLSRLRQLQLISFGVAIVLGGFAGGLTGRFLDHAAAAGNVISRITEPLLGPDPAITIAVCAYLGIAAGMVIALTFNRVLHARAARAVARSADAELLEVLKRD